MSTSKKCSSAPSTDGATKGGPMTAPPGLTPAEHLGMMLYLFHIPELMQELRRVFAHRDYITVMVARGGVRP